jgi:hypothetical protein
MISRASRHLCPFPLRAGPLILMGSEVEGLFRDGRISEIAAYCETDGVNTFRVGLHPRSICGDKC